MARKQPQTAESGPEDVSALGFEAALRELDGVVSQLEQGDLPLEQSLALHSRGQALAAHCAKQIEHAELRVNQLGPDDSVEPAGQP